MIFWRTLLEEAGEDEWMQKDMGQGAKAAAGSDWECC